MIGTNTDKNCKGVYSNDLAGVDSGVAGALQRVYDDLVQAGRHLAAASEEGVDGRWLEDARRHVWGQIAGLSVLLSSPLPSLPHPKRGSPCAACVERGNRRVGVSLLGEERCWVHASDEERSRARVRREQEAKDVAAFLDQVGWPWPAPPTWRELWRENQRTYTRIAISDPLMPVVPSWVRKRSQTLGRS